MNIITHRRGLNFLIKATIVLFLLWAFYRQFYAQKNIGEVRTALNSLVEADHYIYLALAILLMPVNWGLESLKWKQLMRPFLPISLKKAFRAILAGVTISIFTPNRIGEYGGRILEVEAKYNWRGVLATLVGSLSQLIVLLAFGLCGALYYLHLFEMIDVFILSSSIFVGGSLVFIMLLIYFNVDMALPLVRKLPLGRWKVPIYKQMVVLKSYDVALLGNVLFLSAIRYLVYSFQYYLILLFFGVELPVFTVLSGIATIFLVQTSIPLPMVIGLLVRGEIALTVWGVTEVNELAVLAATFLLFIINLSVPALLGLVIIVRTNVLKSLGYAK